MPMCVLMSLIVSCCEYSTLNLLLGVWLFLHVFLVRVCMVCFWGVLSISMVGLYCYLKNGPAERKQTHTHTTTCNALLHTSGQLAGSLPSVCCQNSSHRRYSSAPLQLLDTQTVWFKFFNFSLTSSSLSFICICTLKLI